MNRVLIENSTNLVRDENTNAVINVDVNDYQNYMRMKSTKEKEERRISSLESEIKHLKNDISDIKSLIMGLYK